jgi:hypothetical protein
MSFLDDENFAFVVVVNECSKDAGTVVSSMNRLEFLHGVLSNMKELKINSARGN